MYRHAGPVEVEVVLVLVEVVLVEVEVVVLVKQLAQLPLQSQGCLFRCRRRSRFETQSVRALA